MEALQRLPKTRLGKILCATIKKIADGVPQRIPAAIKDPGVLDDITAALRKRGI
jgi:propionyl-CoA synthetase